MKSLIICFACVLFIVALPFVFSSIDDALTEEHTETYAGTATAAGVYAANVTLGQAVYNNQITSIKDISSNLTGVDAPSAYAFNVVSRILTVNGLDQSLTRTLSVDFLIPSSTLPAGVSDFMVLFRWFYVFIIIGMSGGAIYAFWQT